jgi:hypothetical protein
VEGCVAQIQSQARACPYEARARLPRAEDPLHPARQLLRRVGRGGDLTDVLGKVEAAGGLRGPEQPGLGGG